MELRDPHNRARELAFILPARPGPRFQCDHPVRFYAEVADCDIQCETNPCTHQCSAAIQPAFNLSAEGCGASAAVDVFGDNDWTAKIPNEAAGPWGDFWLAEFVSNLDTFIQPAGFVELEWISLKAARFVDDSGEELEIPIVQLDLTYKQSEASPGSPMAIILATERRGIEQLLYFGMEWDKDFFLKQRGYVPVTGPFY